MTTSIFKRAGLAALVTAGIMLIAVFSVERDRYSKFVAAKLIAAARENDALLTLDGSSMGIFSFSAARARVVLPRFFAWFNLDNPRLALGIPHALFLRPRLSLYAEAYGGQLSASLIYSILSGSLALDFHGDKMQVDKHQQLHGLGLNSGSLSVALTEAVVKSETLAGAQFDLALNDVAKPQTTKLAGTITGLPLDISVPAFKDLNLSLKGNISADAATISITDFHCASSLGTISGSGEVQATLAGKASGTVNAVLNVSLSDEGIKELGPVLPLLGGQGITSSTKDFRLALNGPLNSPTISPSANLNAKLGG